MAIARKKRSATKKRPQKRAKSRPKRAAATEAEKPAPPQRSPNERTIVNEAQRQLCEARVSLGQLATACGVSRPAASKWLTGLTKPADSARRVIERHFGPAPELWDLDPSTDPEPTEPAPADEPEEFEDARTAAHNHLRRIVRLRRMAESRNRSSDLHKLLDLERRAILDLARFSGELTAADESRLTETKRWLEVRKAIVGVLVGEPDALKKVVSALEELGA